MNAAVGVHADDPALDGLGDPQGASQIIGPERPAEAEGGSVNNSNHLGLVIERNNANDRPEDLFTPAASGLINAQQDGRFEIVTLRVRAAAARGEGAAVFPRIRQILL